MSQGGRWIRVSATSRVHLPPMHNAIIAGMWSPYGARQDDGKVYRRTGVEAQRAHARTRLMRSAGRL